MKGRYNPFKPNSPVYTGMFAGRLSETDRIDEILNQTKLGNPSYILIIGERGIGKSSLLLVANHFAKGMLTWQHQKHNFLTVQVSVNDDTSLIDLARKINTSINRELEKSESAIAFCKKTWLFLQKFEIAGTKYRAEKQDQNTTVVYDYPYYYPYVDLYPWSYGGYGGYRPPNKPLGQKNSLSISRLFQLFIKY